MNTTDIRNNGAYLHSSTAEHTHDYNSEGLSSSVDYSRNEFQIRHRHCTMFGDKDESIIFNVINTRTRIIEVSGHHNILYCINWINSYLNRHYTSADIESSYLGFNSAKNWQWAFAEAEKGNLNEDYITIPAQRFLVMSPAEREFYNGPYASLAFPLLDKLMDKYIDERILNDKPFCKCRHKKCAHSNMSSCKQCFIQQLADELTSE